MSNTFSVVEAIGDVHLYFDAFDSSFHVEQDGNKTQLTDENGSIGIGADFTEHTLLYAEELDAGGFQVWWSSGPNQTYYIANHAADGSLTSSSFILHEDAGSYESVFGADLNGDGQIDHIKTLIENTGETSLYLSTDGSLYVEVDGVQTQLLSGATGSDGLGATAFPGEDVTHAALDADGGGFHTLWEGIDDTFTIRGHEADGSLGSTTVISSNDDLVDWETTFGADLNNDGTIGPISNASSGSSGSSGSQSSSIDTESDGDGALIVLAIAGLAILGGGIAMSTGAFGEMGDIT